MDPPWAGWFPLLYEHIRNWHELNSKAGQNDTAKILGSQWSCNRCVFDNLLGYHRIHPALFSREATFEKKHFFHQHEQNRTNVLHFIHSRYYPFLLCCVWSRILLLVCRWRKEHNMASWQLFQDAHVWPSKVFTCIFSWIYAPWYHILLHRVSRPQLHKILPFLFEFSANQDTNLT